jgi:hypothetical protein
MLGQGVPSQTRHPTLFFRPSWSMEFLSFFKRVDAMFNTFSFTLVLLLQLSFYVLSCNAQSTEFVWGFGDNFVSTSLSECQILPLVVTSLNNDGVTFGVPPYYMMAMELGGTPTIDYVGTDRTALSWVVNHAAGTKLMLSMVDSNGSAGGIPPNLYTVGAGIDTSCLPPPTPYEFTVSANVTNTLTTCQPWGITINGGIQPYSVTLAALNSPIITNVTMGPTDNSFTYIDRANPNTQLLVAVSDSNGNFATGTPIVHTQGSSNVACTGLVSSSGNATIVQAADAAASAAANAAQAHKRTTTTIAVTVILLLLSAAGGVIIYLYLRKRTRLTENIDGQDTKPRKFEEVARPISITLPIDLPSTPSSRSSLAPPYSSHFSDVKRPLSSDREEGSLHYPSRFPSSRKSSLRTHGANEPDALPITEVRRAATAIPPPRGRRLPQLPSRSVSANVRPRSGNSSVAPDIIIQHRDGGVVQELPPPYRFTRTMTKV